MAGRQSIGKRARRKANNRPPKPYPDFPLTPHPLGYWVKSINGTVHRFGRWGRQRNGKMVRLEGDGWRESLDLYLKQKDDLYAGREPSDDSEGELTVANLCNEFLRTKTRQVDTGELAQRSFDDYFKVCERLVKVFGKSRSVENLSPKDFAKLRSNIAKNRGLVSINGQITRTRVVFNYAMKNHLISRSVRYGSEFDRPSAKSLRQERANAGSKMLESADCRKLIDEAQSPELKAMILLALNCGFGNSDCAKLPMKAVGFKDGWIEFPRPKTGIVRRCPLWPETVSALETVRDRRDPERDLLFVTKYGNTYAEDQACITKEFRKLLDATSLHRPRLGFYSLRHVFRTIADESRDIPAVRHIMGHVDGSIDAVYRERISDDRLRAVVEHVREWLFAASMSKNSSW